MSDQYCELLPDSLIPVWVTYAEYDSLMSSWMVGPQPLNSGPDCFSNDGSPYFAFQLITNVPYTIPDEQIYFICFREIVKVQTNVNGEYRKEHWMPHKRFMEYLEQLPKPIEHFFGEDPDEAG